MTKSPLPTPFEPWRGVFETLRVLRGRPQFLSAHLAEFQRACGALGLACPFDPAAAVTRLPADAIGRWRWIARPAGVTHFFTTEASIPLEHPFPLNLARVRLGAENLDARFKTLSYLTHAQAAAENPGGEAVLLNEHGQIASAARANLFWWADDSWETPALECGCRAGVVRAWMLAHAPVRVVKAPAARLDAAREILVTNAMRGLQPVSHWSGRPLPPAQRGLALRRDYQLAARRSQ